MADWMVEARGKSLKFRKLERTDGIIGGEFISTDISLVVPENFI
jgi:hypothetical protein